MDLVYIDQNGEEYQAEEFYGGSYLYYFENLTFISEEEDGIKCRDHAYERYLAHR